MGNYWLDLKKSKDDYVVGFGCYEDDVKILERSVMASSVREHLIDLKKEMEILCQMKLRAQFPTTR